MEKGVIRFEANVSVRPAGSDVLGTRTEIKNLNSFRAMERAVAYEVNRQSQVIDGGGQVIQETVGWDESSGETVSQRGKEEAHDYRYFPEPDLPPLHLEPTWIEEIRSILPELPHEKLQRFTTEYHLTPYTASVLTAERDVADFFERAMLSTTDIPAIKIANWLSSDFFGLLNETGISIDQSKVTPEMLAELVHLVETGEINASSGKVVLERMFETGEHATSIVEKEGLRQITDPKLIHQYVEDVLNSHPDQLHQYLEGKHTIQQWFFGQVMRATGGRADPAIVRKKLIKCLKDLEESRH
jgi:aspartyl-tRNA(Asn)/glutamyl-tRNA(Gln) amidotransferase subunit B